MLPSSTTVPDRSNGSRVKTGDMVMTKPMHSLCVMSGFQGVFARGRGSVRVYRISAINRPRLGTSSLLKMERRCFFTVSTLKPASSAIS
jgi:hypothetical protein